MSHSSCHAEGSVTSAILVSLTDLMREMRIAIHQNACLIKFEEDPRVGENRAMKRAATLRLRLTVAASIGESPHLRAWRPPPMEGMQS